MWSLPVPSPKPPAEEPLALIGVVVSGIPARQDGEPMPLGEVTWHFTEKSLGSTHEPIARNPLQRTLPAGTFVVAEYFRSDLYPTITGTLSKNT